MSFNAEKAANAAIAWIRDWFEDNGHTCSAVLGISGGKDSSVVAALCAEALGKSRVIGVLLPNGVQSDIDMAEKLINHLDINSYKININGAYTSLISELSENLDKIDNCTKVNLPARIRMSTLYALSQSSNGRVANTCNLSEDWVGYSTRYGDSVGDFSPISSFTTVEVRAIGEYLGLPEELINKTPTDGLSSMTDEEKLGFSYEILDNYIRTGEIDDKNAKDRIDTLHRQNLFKLRYMDCFVYQE